MSKSSAFRQKFINLVDDLEKSIEEFQKNNLNT